jgi:hypothetical protein
MEASAIPPPSVTSTPSINVTDLAQLGKGGSLRQLSDSMINMAQAIAATGLFATSYDNLVFCAVEQIIGHTGKNDEHVSV